MSLMRHAFIVSAFSLTAVAGGVHAQTAVANTMGTVASGLGQSWPNTADVSASAGYHVYVFDRAGVRYIQVNDAHGTVLGAFARSPYSLVGLPIGSAAADLATEQEPLPAPASTARATIVYRDASVQVVVAPQPSGTVRIMAVSVDCKDPVECSSKGP